MDQFQIMAVYNPDSFCGHFFFRIQNSVCTSRFLLESQCRAVIFAFLIGIQAVREMKHSGSP